MDVTYQNRVLGFFTWQIKICQVKYKKKVIKGVIKGA